MRCCLIEADARALLERAAERLALSARGFHRALRVARTVADLADAERAAADHVAEAVGFRQTSTAPEAGGEAW